MENKMTSNKWRAQHESGNIIECAAKDLRGLQLMRECGYNWINLCDNNGWQPIVFVIGTLSLEEHKQSVKNMLDTFVH